MGLTSNTDRLERAANFILTLWERIRRARKRKRTYPVSYTDRVRQAQDRQHKERRRAPR